MRFKIMIFVIVVFLTTVASQDSNCPSGWLSQPYSDSCYFFSTNTVNQNNAVKECQKLGASLVSVTSVAEQVFLQTNGGSKPYWIGLSREAPKKGWKWLDKSPFIFLNWDSSYKFESDGSKLCAIMDKNGQWKSSVCYEYSFFVFDVLKYNYICERLAEGLATSTVSPLTTQPGFDYGCTNGWTKNGNKCFMVYDSINDLKTFDEAKSSCQSQDADMVEIESKSQNEFITNLVSTGYGKRRMMMSNRLDLDCPASWTKQNNQCYKFIDSPVKDWNIAQTTCKKQGANLASIKNKEENEYLFNFASSDIWIGLKRDSNSSLWLWPDSSNSIFTNWKQSYPTSDTSARCAVAKITMGDSSASSSLNNWIDASCQDVEARSFVCQKETAIQDSCSRYSSENFFGGATCIDKNQCSNDNYVKGLCSEYGNTNLECCLNSKLDNIGVWLGLSSETNKFNQTFFTHVSKSEPKYTNWALNEPDLISGTCVSMYKTDISKFSLQFSAGDWLMEPCRYKNFFMCQKNIQLILITDPVTVPGCPQGFTDHFDKCFKLQDDPTTWSEAEQACASSGGNLASISDRFEQYWINNNLNVKTDSWIGLAMPMTSNFDSSYKWSSNDKVDFTHWDRNYPNATEGKCVVMRPNGFWANMPCEVKRSSICMTYNTVYTTTRQPTTTEPPKCSNGWTEADGVCHRAYKIDNNNKENTSMNWFDAEKYCQHIGGHLSSFRSLKSLQDVLRGQSIWDGGSWNYVPYWFGLNRIDSEEGWQYSDSSPVSFTNWDRNYPDDSNGISDCVEISGNYRMVNSICYSRKGWFCSLKRGIQPLSPDDFEPIVPKEIVMCDNNTNYNFTLFNNKCYYVSAAKGDESLSWFKSREFCQNIGSDLVSIHSGKELEYITSLTSKKGGRWWLGLNQLSTFSQGFVWSDGSPLNFINWANGEPNDANAGEKCVEQIENLKWNDGNCAVRQGFICEKNNGDIKPKPKETLLPLVFNDGNGDPCPEGYSTFGIFSVNKDGETNKCEFPFTYNGTVYNECITKTRSGADNPWCSHTSDYDKDKKWGYCIDVKCFKIDSTKRSFSSARKSCQADKANLASVHSPIEHAYLTSLIRTKVSDDPWIGLWNPDGSTFYYEDNTELEFTKWAPNNPTSLNWNKNCVTMSKKSKQAGLWENVNCNNLQPSICSKYPNGVRYVSGCEASFLGNLSETFSLTCEPGQTITIIKADFGRDQNSMTCDIEFNYNGDCTSRVQTTEKVRELCKNNSTCELSANIDTFDDPCPGVIKQLRVWYQCVKNPILSNGGNGNGAACVFPFKYKDKMHYQCSHEKNPFLNSETKRWCCTNSDCDDKLEWGFCPENKAPLKSGCDKEGYSSPDSGQNCYRHFTDEKKTWQEASTKCQQDSGSLVTIRDAFEQSFLTLISYLNAAEDLNPWIGLKKDGLSNVFKWSDGWPVDYENWSDGYVFDNSSDANPDSCAFIESSTGVWNVSSCKEQRSFVCKITKDTIPTTTTRAPERCPTDLSWIHFDDSSSPNKCYRYESQYRSFPDAKYDCIQKGGYLASVNSQADHAFLKGLMPQSWINTWIGLEKNYKSNKYEWNDGSIFNFNKFSSLSPSLPCVSMRGDLWYDENCIGITRPYFCQREGILSNLTTTTSTTPPPSRTTTFTTASTARPTETFAPETTVPSNATTQIIPTIFSTTKLQQTTTEAKNTQNKNEVPIAGIVVGLCVLIAFSSIGVIYFLNKRGLTNIKLPFISSNNIAHTRMENPTSIQNPNFD